MVELGQVRRGNLYGTHDGRLLLPRQWCGRRTIVGGTVADTLQDPLDIKACLGLILRDDPLDDIERMLLQQLQDANVVLGSASWSVLPLQSLS